MNWKSIEEFSRYIISDTGLVIRLSYTEELVTEQTEKAVKRSYQAIDMRQSIDSDGYCVLGLTDDAGIRHQKRVNRLVLEAFVGKSDLMCLHKDGVRTNNNLDNLYWGTAKDNADDCLRHGNRPSGSEHQLAKLTKDDVDYIRSFQSYYGYRKILAEKFNVFPSTIDKVRRGETYAST